MNNRYVTKTLYKHLGVTFRSYLDELEEVHFESSDKVICVSIKQTSPGYYKLHICDTGFCLFEYLTFNSFIKAVEYLKANYKTHFFIRNKKYNFCFDLEKHMKSRKKALLKRYKE